MTQPWAQQPYQQPAPDVRLSNAVAHEVRNGFRVESQAEAAVWMVKGSKPNHVLHLLLTVFTCGFWVIGWVIVAMTQKEERISLSFAPDGRLVRQFHRQ